MTGFTSCFLAVFSAMHKMCVCACVHLAPFLSLNSMFFLLPAPEGGPPALPAGRGALRVPGGPEVPFLLVLCSSRSSCSSCPCLRVMFNKNREVPPRAPVVRGVFPLQLQLQGEGPPLEGPSSECRQTLRSPRPPSGGRSFPEGSSSVF